jgi:hypothetical protein
VTDDNERRARAIARIERRNVVRRLRGATPAEPEIDWHARVWRPIERALDAGRNPTPKDILSAAAADPSFSDAFWLYVTDLPRGKAKQTHPPREELKPTRGVKPQSWSVERALEEYYRFMTEEEAPKPRRLPSIDDLLGVVAANAGVPEAVRDHIQRFRDGKAKLSRGPRPSWRMNHSSWQFTRDVVLVATFDDVLKELKEDPERRGQTITMHDVFVQFVDEGWGAEKAWGLMAAEHERLGGPWKGGTPDVRYSEAKARLDALRAVDEEGHPFYRYPE